MAKRSIALSLLLILLGIAPTLIAEGDPALAAKLGLRASRPRKDYPLMKEAALLARRSAEALAERRLALGWPLDPRVDPNKTGFLGPEFTEITTTIGDPVAKRTSANPDFAALMVLWFGDLGLKRGDRVAIAASGSFPALAVAVLAACQVMGLEPVMTLSLGASEFGATIPGLNAAQMILELNRRGMVDASPAAVSLGGEKDAGVSEFPGHETKEALNREAVATGLPILDPEAGEEGRMAIFFAGAAPKVFVNIGGGEVALGSTSASLRLPKGMILPGALGYASLGEGRGERRGLVLRFLDRGIPVVHLLDIKGLALKAGLPVDPVPLPEPGGSAIYMEGSKPKLPAFLGLASALAVLGAPIWKRKSGGRRPEAGGVS